jgi:hypothetical protein
MVIKANDEAGLTGLMMIPVKGLGLDNWVGNERVWLAPHMVDITTLSPVAFCPVFICGNVAEDKCGQWR